MFGIPDADDLAAKVLRIIEERERAKEQAPRDLLQLVERLKETRSSIAHEQSVVGVVRELAAQGMGCTEMARALNEQGIRSILGGKFYAGSVRALCRFNNITVNTRSKRGRRPKNKSV